MWSAGLVEAQVGTKIARRNINLSYADDIILMAEREEALEYLDESERGEWKSDLKLIIQKTTIMASSSFRCN